MTAYKVIYLPLFLCILASCARQVGGPINTARDPVKVEVGQFKGLGFAQPIGMHHIHDSDYLIFKERPHLTNFSMVLGVIATVTSSNIQSVANSRFIRGHETTFQAVDLHDITQELLDKRFFSERRSLEGFNEKKIRTVLTNFGVIEYKDQLAHLVYVTDVDLYEENEHIWRHQYHSASPYKSLDALLEAGEDGLRSDAEQALRTNLKRFFSDMRNPDKIPVKHITKHRFLYK